MADRALDKFNELVDKFLAISRVRYIGGKSIGTAIPKEVRDQVAIHEGDRLIWSASGNQIVLRVVKKQH